MTVALTIQSVLLVVLAVFVVGLLRSHAQILRSLATLGASLADPDSEAAQRRGRDQQRTVASSDAPARTADTLDLVGTTPLGDPVSIAVAGTPQVNLLAFLSTTCMTCLEFWQAFAETENQYVVGRGSQVVLVTKEAEDAADVDKLAPSHLHVVMSKKAFEDYDVPYAPWFVLIDGAESRVLGEGSASSFDELQRLLVDVLAESGFRPGGQRSRRQLLRELRMSSAEGDAPG
jgi:hypothetical protein